MSQPEFYEWPPIVCVTVNLDLIGKPSGAPVDPRPTMMQMQGEEWPQPWEKKHKKEAGA